MSRRYNVHVVGWITLLCIWAWGAAAAPLAAQAPWTPGSLRIELRGEGAWPTGELRDILDDRGFGFGAAVRYVPVRPLAVYAGIDRFSFKESEEGVKTHLHDTGVRAGVQLVAPLGARVPLTPFAAAGLLYNWTWLKRSANDVSREVHADPRFGFEVGGGVAVHVARHVWLVPELRFRQHEADIGDVLGSDHVLTVSYLGLNFGLLFEL